MLLLLCYIAILEYLIFHLLEVSMINTIFRLVMDVFFCCCVLDPATIYLVERNLLSVKLANYFCNLVPGSRFRNAYQLIGTIKELLEVH